MQVRVAVSVGELLDKISILRIKARRIGDPAKLDNVRRELELLEPAAVATGLELENWYARLDAVNDALWRIEDDIRALEARSDFGDEFVRLARAVYLTNDKRAAIKREINAASGSEVVEEKSYEEY